MSCMLVLGLIPAGAFAAEGKSIKHVTAIADITTAYTVPNGAAISDIGLPSEVTVTVETPATQEGKSATTTQEQAAVVWNGTYDGTAAGTYVLEAAFEDDAYDFDSMPVVNVTVEAPSQPAVEEPAEEAPAPEQPEATPADESAEEAPADESAEAAPEAAPEASVSTLAEEAAPRSGTVDDLTISSPLMTLDTSSDASTVIQSNSTRGYSVSFNAKATDNVGVTNVWIGYRFTLQVPEGMRQNDAQFTQVGYSWLMDLKTGTRTATPTYDAATRTWTLEGKFKYTDTPGLGSTATQGYTRSLAVSVEWLEEGQKVVPTAQVWLPEKENSQTVVAQGTELTVDNTPTLNNNRYGLAESITGYYSASQKQFYLTKGAAAQAGAADAVPGRVYRFGTGVDMNVAGSWKGAALIANGTPVTQHIDVSVTKGGQPETDASLQPILLAAHYDDSREAATNVYDGALAAGTDITYGGREKGFISGSGSATDLTMTGVSYTNNTITSSMSASDTGGRKGVWELRGYYQVFVPVSKDDTETTNRQLVIGPVTSDAATHAGGTTTEVNNSAAIASIKVLPLSDEDFTGAYTRSISLDGAARLRAVGTGGIGLEGTLTNVKTDAWAEITSYDMLFKIDADAYVVDSSVTAASYWGGGYKNGTRTLKYGVLPGGGNWASDDAMTTARKSALTFYEPGQVPAGAKVVAVLAQGRGGFLGNGTEGVMLQGVSITTDATKAGEVHQVTLDVDVWAAGADPNQAPSGTMYSDGYKKATYDADGTYHKEVDGALKGRSLLLTAYKMAGTAKNLNGSNITSGDTSTFDVTSGQRIADVMDTVTLEYMGDPALENKDQDITFEVSILKKNKNTVLNPDSVRLGATYIPNGENPAGAGVIQGGTKPDSVVETSNEYKFTFTVKGSGAHEVYSSYTLGNALDPDSEVDIGRVDRNVFASPSGASANMVANAYSRGHAFVIVKSSAAGFRKIAGSGIASANEEIRYQLVLSAQHVNLSGTLMLDVLPFDNDGRGSSFSGTYTIDKPLELRVTSTNTTLQSDVSVYYTTDKAIQRTPGYTVDDLAGVNVSGDTASALGVTWHKATMSGSGNSFTYTVDPNTTAIMSAGIVGQNESPLLDMYLQMKDMKPGDKLANTASFSAKEYSESMNSETAGVSIASREIKGIAWIDANANGAQDDGEAGLAGLGVKLYQGTTEVTQDQDGNAYAVTTGADGSYSFGTLPSSAEAYHVVFSGGDINYYAATEKTAAGVADDKNSDVTADPATGVMTSAVSDEVYVLTQEQQAAQNKTMEVKVLDGGFVPLSSAQLPVAGIKTLSGGGKTNTDIAAGQFDFTVTRTDTNGNAVTGVPTTAVSTAAGTANGAALDFGSWVFSKIGTYTFTIAEGQAAAGYVNAPDVNVEVRVTQNAATGALEAAATYSSGDKLTFANTYATPDSASFAVAGNKTLTEGGTAKAMEADQFSFTMTEDSTNDKTGYTGFTGNASTAVNGGFTFGTLDFSKAGTYKFNITEDDLGAAGYTYDAKTVVLTVEVALDPATNKLATTGTYSEEGADVPTLSFANEYATPDPAGLAFYGTKYLTEDGAPKAFVDGQFSFNIAADPTNDTTGYTGFTAGSTTAGGNGTIAFDTVNFTKAGTYKFVITENNLGAAGYTYDDKAVTATVKVELDAATNKLAATVSYEKDGQTVGDMVFNNTYTTPDPDTFAVAGSKTLTEDGTAKAMEADQFSFTMVEDPTNDKTGYTGFVGSASMAENGGFTFGSMNFSKAGTYKFNITEDDLGAAGYTYDAKTVVLTVDVALDPNTNKLATTGTYTEDGADVPTLSFANEYATPDPAQAALAGTKTLDGHRVTADIEAGQFTFAVASDPTNNASGFSGLNETVEVKAGGAIDFGTLSFSKVGTYKFTFSENNLGQMGYTYDDARYMATIEVTLNTQMNKLEQTTTFEKVGANGNQKVDAITFANTYVPNPVKSDPPVQKVVEGSPETPGEFVFTMKAEDVANPMPEGSVDGIKEMSIKGAGVVEFGEIEFVKAGTYRYVIAELDGGLAGYAYDTTTYAVTYVVTDNGSGNLQVVRTIEANGKQSDTALFTNVYTAPVDPVVDNVDTKPTQPGSKAPSSKLGNLLQTGDNALLQLVGMVAVGAFALMGATFLAARRRSSKR